MATYLESGKQYSLYDWIEVPTQKSRSDPRPESYKVVSHHIIRISHLSTDKGSWRSRQEYIFSNPSWHFASVGALKHAEQESGRSLGLVVPGSIKDICLIKKTDKERREYEEKMSEVQQQRDLFLPEYKELEFLPYDIKLLWRCRETCPECTSRPHNMKVLDWGLLELGRREGWEKARAKLEEVSNLSTHDFRIFLGNFRLHRKNFGIVGLWYPKKRVQLELI